ncbi:class IV lanthionine synthetase LanL [Streptomyces sp. CG1]|uniref:class IV lanthionine synthetase LanL n=1 Tax=Streptomyces sp. CG1 TaxID=1287523 RepID=UPI0034E1B922
MEPGRIAEQSLLMDCVRSVLSRHQPHEWQIRPGEFWCHVRLPEAPARIQGWKLHISATPLSAPLVLARTAEVLAAHHCPFKFAGTLSRVAELCSRQTARGSGGKFITAYPDGDDDRLRVLAEELHRATEGLPGPSILSDRPYRPGSLVHYRFGAFQGVPMLGNEASYEVMLMAPDGSLDRDRREAWFSPPPWAPRDPFTGQRPGPPAPGTTAPRPVRLDDRYIVREVVRHAFTGGVYRATDERDGRAVIIKQARPHTGATATGTDICNARRHEAAMLKHFASSGRTPRLVALFEQQGELFLVQEAIAGVTLRQWVAGNITLEAVDDGGEWGLSMALAERLATGLADLVELVHREGFALRDLNPNNVMVTEDHQLRLIDLELLARPGERVVHAHTPGYAAPEQAAARSCDGCPDPTADLYGLGATLLYLLTGVDPLLAPDDPPARPYRQRIAGLLDQLSRDNPAARRFAPLVLALLHERPEGRPGLAEVRRALAGQARLAPPAVSTAVLRRPAGPELKQLTDDALEHLLATMTPDTDRLWPPSSFGATSDPLNLQHGAAGVLGVLARALRAEPGAELREAVATAAGWIVRRTGREPRALPGLYFGRSGTAWALLDAAEALGDETLADTAADLAQRIPLGWPNPDICHGSAGAGMTQLRFWEATGDQDFLRRAGEAAESVAAAAVRRDDRLLWPIPRDWPSNLAGLVHYGFAHGVAGTGTFLLAAGRATGESAYMELAEEAAQTLLATAHHDDGAAYWTAGPSGGARKTNWCSGSSGIGTFLLRLWQQNGDARLRASAEAAAIAVRRTRWHTGTAQCHGLAGDGEFLLDLAQACGQPQHIRWAEQLAVALHTRHTIRDGRVLAPDETGTSVVTDYGTGLSGVLAFLLRLRDGGPRLWLSKTFTGPYASDTAGEPGDRTGTEGR